MKRIARMRITRELLLHLLQLPEGTRIEAIRQSPQDWRDIEVRLTSPALEPVEECSVIPLVVAIYESVEGIGRFKEFTQ